MTKRYGGVVALQPMSFALTGDVPKIVSILGQSGSGKSTMGSLMLGPKLLVADEPVSMVDASLRATILKNIHDLKDRHGISILYITHDLATAYHVSDDVIVLYQGHVAAAGPPGDVIGDPRHPYTRMLIDPIPWPDLDRDWGTPSTAQEDAARLDRFARETRTVMRGGIAGFTLST